MRALFNKAGTVYVYSNGRLRWIAPSGTFFDLSYGPSALQTLIEIMDVEELI